jgi:hypothetical protein
LEVEKKILLFKNSKSYKLKENKSYKYVFHFKSIDLWLRGVLKSHCPQHTWEKNGTDKIDVEISKYSAFNQDNDEDEYDDVEGQND